MQTIDRTGILRKKNRLVVVWGTLTEGSTKGKLATAREYDGGKLALPSVPGDKETGNVLL